MLILENSNDESAVKEAKRKENIFGIFDECSFINSISSSCDLKIIMKRDFLLSLSSFYPTSLKEFVRNINRGSCWILKLLKFPPRAFNKLFSFSHINKSTLIKKSRKIIHGMPLEHKQKVTRMINIFSRNYSVKKLQNSSV